MLAGIFSAIGGLFGFGDDSQDEKPMVEEPGKKKNKGSVRSSKHNNSIMNLIVILRLDHTCLFTRIKVKIKSLIKITGKKPELKLLNTTF